MNRNCSACDIIIDINNYKKDRTVCKTCYNKNKRKNNIENVNKKFSDFENVNKKLLDFENHRHVVIGPSNVGKTFYMLKVLEKLGNKRPIHIITRSSNQYPNYKTSTEIKPTKQIQRISSYF